MDTIFSTYKQLCPKEQYLFSIFIHNAYDKQILLDVKTIILTCEINIETSFDHPLHELYCALNTVFALCVEYDKLNTVAQAEIMREIGIGENIPDLYKVFTQYVM